MLGRRYGVLPHVIRDLPAEDLAFARLCHSAALQAEREWRANNPEVPVFPAIVVGGH